MITAGVDIGSLTAEAVILKDGEMLSYSLIPTGYDSAKTAQRAMDEALAGAGLGLRDIEFVVATGYGRVIVPFAHKCITEISCHAKGAHWLFPGARAILDMGGQDCKAIRCDAFGKVTNFVMNDKCAAGCGRSMEVMAELLGISLEDIGWRSLETVNGSVPISSVCVVFAKTEVMGLLRRGVHKHDVLAGYCDALAKRIHTLLQRVGVEEEFVITGGIAKNIGVVRRLEAKLGLKARISPEPQIVGALGAALFAEGALDKSRRAA